MAAIMTKQGNLDNIITYEHICDTFEDIQTIDPHYITLGSTCVVINGESGGLEVYMANSEKEWVSLSIASESGEGSSSLGIQILGSNDYDSETGIPNISEPLENIFYLVPSNDDSNNIYNEWVYVNNNWELFGSSGNIDISNKVDKIEGKGLSTNDYTTEEKNKLENIEEGAQVNTVTGVKGNSETGYRIGNINITKANIGLSNVDNTSDIDKPLSKLQSNAIEEAVQPIRQLGPTSIATIGSKSVEAPLQNISIYGKSVLNSTSSTIINLGDEQYINIRNTGKNLFNINSLTTSDNSTLEITDNVFRVKSLGNKTFQGASTSTRFISGIYTLSFDATINTLAEGGNRIGFRKTTDNTFINAITIETSGHYSISCNANEIFYISFCANRNVSSIGDITFSNVMLVNNSIELKYEPYIGQFLTFSLSSPLCGIAVENGGNYVDSKGIHWVCDILDKNEGTINRRCGIINSYNGESLPGVWMSNMDQYVAGMTPTNGAYVVYELENSINENLTASQIAQLNLLKTYNEYTSLYSYYKTIQADILIQYVSSMCQYVDEQIEKTKIKTISTTETNINIIGIANTRYICGEVSTLDFTPPAEGIVDIIFTSGSSKTILTLPNTVKMPDWFDVEANMTYEISIADGVYGVVTSWAV